MISIRHLLNRFWFETRFHRPEEYDMRPDSYIVRTEDDFIRIMADRVSENVTMGRKMVEYGCRSYLHDCRMKFGDPDFDWTADGAVDMADEFLAEIGER